MSETRQYPEWMGKMRGLTSEELTAFLAGPLVARIATIDDDGFPYLTPVWEEWDGQAMYIIPRERTVFVKHILKNPKVAISCALDSGTYTRMLMRGVAEILSGPVPLTGTMLEMAQRMSIRYLGEHGPEYLQASQDRPRYLVRVTPLADKKLITWDGVEWAEKYTSDKA